MTESNDFSSRLVLVIRVGRQLLAQRFHILVKNQSFRDGMDLGLSFSECVTSVAFFVKIGTLVKRNKDMNWTQTRLPT